jgi:hypothetical protein
MMVPITYLPAPRGRKSLAEQITADKKKKLTNELGQDTGYFIHPWDGPRQKSQLR